ncbi:hypothetical protein DL767_006692 [Monosporascus sp. MG133]|nr:hypothetical protein DL767_006692 [Monosporascus sp. MG133]
MKNAWRPQWEVQDRQPTFLGRGDVFRPFNATGKYLWGNVPAYDVLKLQPNEGSTYSKDLDLLFAASGDLRNVVATVASIPREYSRKVNIVLNDRDSDVVARNTVMLLVMLTQEDPMLAAETVLHIWYSAFVTQSVIDVINGKPRQLVQAVCTKIEGREPDVVLAKTWTFGERSLPLVLTKDQWISLLSHFDLPTGLTYEMAKQNRVGITLAPERVDFRERGYFAQKPSSRIVNMRFREEGILLPFGRRRDAFIHPNPTIFRTIDSWPLKDHADPLDGWPIYEPQNISGFVGANDVHGKLYIYLKKLLVKFHESLSAHKITFRLFNSNIEELMGHIWEYRFDRVEVRLLKICSA